MNEKHVFDHEQRMEDQFVVLTVEHEVVQFRFEPLLLRAAHESSIVSAICC
jgi:hypothetical protein